MSYEVDVLAVGEGTKSGDAIALRYGNFSHRSGYVVVIIDGGFKSNGEKLVELVRERYLSESVDIVIATHPDQDHISGLTVVLENLTVGQLWMHLPWNHSASVMRYLTSGYVGSLTEAQQRSIAGARGLAGLAEANGVPIFEPFTGMATPDGVLSIVGPTEQYYNELMGSMVDGTQSMTRRIVEQLKAAAGRQLRKLTERWNVEELQEPEANAVTERNNSSAIVLAQLDDKVFLFTGDAGVPALVPALAPHPWLPERLTHLQIPHHGSKRNVGPALMDFLLGPKLPEDRRDERTGKMAFVSVAKESDGKHPSPRVTNAAIRRGAEVSTTRDGSHWYHSLDAPNRGWGPLVVMDFIQEYEE